MVHGYDNDEHTTESYQPLTYIHMYCMYVCIWCIHTYVCTYIHICIYGVYGIYIHMFMYTVALLSCHSQQLMAAILVLSSMQVIKVSPEVLNVQGSFPPLVAGLRQVRLPMMGSAVGGVRLPGPQGREGEGRSKGGGRQGGGEIQCTIMTTTYTLSMCYLALCTHVMLACHGQLVNMTKFDLSVRESRQIAHYTSEAHCVFMTQTLTQTMNSIKNTSLLCGDIHMCTLGPQQ